MRLDEEDKAALTGAFTCIGCGTGGCVGFLLILLGFLWGVAAILRWGFS